MQLSELCLYNGNRCVFVEFKYVNQKVRFLSILFFPDILGHFHYR